MSTTFKDLSLKKEIIKAIDALGFSEATKVQSKTIPIILEGNDILAQSRTGTGKTLAFAIPAVSLVDKDVSGVQVLILSPTRELAQQCTEEIHKITKFMPYIKTADIYGGADYSPQFRALKTANVVIGTPGRLIDHINRGSLKLNKLKIIVLDEADEMLNMGFREDIEEILKDTPEERQTLMFSATVPKAIVEIANSYLTNPKKVNLVTDNATIGEITQLFINVPKQHKINSLKLLAYFYKPKRAIVFSNTKSMVDELADILNAAGFSACGIHGDLKQRQRTKVMGDFKSGKTSILIATDVAARGIDVSDIDYVINFDIPKMDDYYVHRIGRTGRAGKSGVAVTICCGNKETAILRAMSRKLKCDINEMAVPTVESISKKDSEGNLNKVLKRLTKEEVGSATNIHLVKTLLEQGYSAEKIAVAIASIAFKAKARAIEDIPTQASKPERFKNKSSKFREDVGGRFKNIHLDIGSSSRCRTNHIVGAITEKTGIDGRMLGKIVIDENDSLVAVPESMIDDIVFELRGIKICGRPVKASFHHSENKDRKPSKFAKKGKRAGFNKDSKFIKRKKKK